MSAGSLGSVASAARIRVEFPERNAANAAATGSGADSAIASCKAETSRPAKLRIIVKSARDIWAAACGRGRGGEGPLQAL